MQFLQYMSIHDEQVLFKVERPVRKVDGLHTEHILWFIWQLLQAGSAQLPHVPAIVTPNGIAHLSQILTLL